MSFKGHVISKKNNVLLQLTFENHMINQMDHSDPTLTVLDTLKMSLQRMNTYIVNSLFLWVSVQMNHLAVVPAPMINRINEYKISEYEYFQQCFQSLLIIHFDIYLSFSWMLVRFKDAAPRPFLLPGSTLAILKYDWLKYLILGCDWLTDLQ